jgi:glutamyl-tRNA reductase
VALVLVGINHRTAPVDVRERLSMANKLGEHVTSLRSLDGVEGGAIVSTCNRVEVVVSTPNEDVIASIVDWLAERGGTIRAELEKHLYILRHGDVIAHLFRVASGLDSMIVGEPQIAGQVKTAFQTSHEHNALDGVLLQLFEHTMRVSKKVRTDTGIGEHAVSVPYAAVELAKKIFGDLSALNVLIIGAGEMAELTAEHLSGFSPRQIFVANRAFERAVDLAARFQGHAIQFDVIEPHLAACDIVVASTGAPHYIITPSQVARALENRKRRNLFLIDLSVPRNIDPEVAQMDGAYLYNIDDLQLVADTNRALRAEKAQQAEEIVVREVDGFRKRMATQDAVPTIVELQQRLEEIRASETEKCLRKLGPITPEQRDAIEMLTTQMVNKVLHYPILQLREGAEEPQERESLRRTIRKIFGLR